MSYTAMIDRAYAAQSGPPVTLACGHEDGAALRCEWCHVQNCAECTWVDPVDVECIACAKCAPKMIVELHTEIAELSSLLGKTDLENTNRELRREIAAEEAKLKSLTAWLKSYGEGSHGQAFPASAGIAIIAPLSDARAGVATGDDPPRQFRENTTVAGRKAAAHGATATVPEKPQG